MIESAQVFDFISTDEDMKASDSLITREDTQNFVTLYRKWKCVNKYTSKDETMDGVKMNITEISIPRE